MAVLTEERADATDSLLATVEGMRRDVSKHLDRARRALMGQFLTPMPVALFMAEMFRTRKPVLRVLDPGAGIGSLSAAFVAAMCHRKYPPQAVVLTAYEIDPELIGYLKATLDLCRAASLKAGIRFEAYVVNEDFLEAAARFSTGHLFAASIDEPFDAAILNPPYRKIRSESRERKLLRELGVETSNLYTGFLAAIIQVLDSGGEMVAITPRSFCNGPYFEPFRRFFLRTMRFRHIHLFDARDRAFAEDKVLQENIIFRAQKTTEAAPNIVVSSSLGPSDPHVHSRVVLYNDLVRPGDRHKFIHIAPDHCADPVRQKMGKLKATVADLGLAVSTGRVVDFRAKDLLRAKQGSNTVPLIYPCHLRHGYVEWPNGQTRKPNALALGPRSVDLLIPAEYYVVVKRFSTKEEPRRVVAAVYDPARVATDRVAFENHLNYYHLRGGDLPAALARGLTAFLNSTLVDSYFRQFSGHTQVNAADLRSLRYPTWDQLMGLGRKIGERFPDQESLDRLVDEVIFHG